MARKKNHHIEIAAIEIFRSHGGILRSSDAIKLGIHPRILYRLKENGEIQQLPHY